MNHRYFAAASLGLLVLGGFSTAEGAIVEQIVNLPRIDNAVEGIGQVGGSSFSLDRSVFASFNLFDANLGTLTGVKISYDYRFELQIDFGASGGSSGGSAGGPIFINGDTGAPPTGGGNGTGGGGAPNSTSFFPFAITGAYSVPNDNDAYETTDFVASFVGETGSFNLVSTFNVSPSEGTHAAVDVLPTSTVKVEYTYTPVPEPGTLSLAALGGLAFLRRRRG